MTSGGLRSFAVCFALASELLVVAGTSGALAAVRVCHPLVIGRIVEADSEKAAKRAALKDWTDKARAGGLEHPHWRVATNKRLKCEKAKGRYTCVALGQPCTILQKAPTPQPRPSGPKVDT